MSSISCLVTNLDCCSSQIGFTYKGKRRYKSLIGGCLTIICFIVIMAIIIAYMVKYFTRAEKTIFYQDKKDLRPPLIDISNDFHIAIMMQYQGVNMFRDDMIKIKAMYKKRDDDMYSEREVTTYKCNKEDFPTYNDTVFNYLEIGNALCLNFEGVDLQGGNRCADKDVIRHFF